MMGSRFLQRRGWLALACVVGLGVGSACEFGGDRSLGLVEGLTGGTASGTGGVASGAGGAALGTGGAASGGMPSVPISGTATVSSCSPDAASTPCKADEFCAVDSFCGREGRSRLGSCTPRPSDCPAASSSSTRVCGCDGTFYESSCHAALGGIAISDLSGCDPIPCSGDAACRQFDTNCLSLTGPGSSLVRGAICDDGICACGGVSMIF